MTNKEAVLSLCGVSVNESAADLELINAGLDASGAYSSANQSTIAKAACEVLNSMLSISSVKEGDFSVSIDRQGIQDRLVYLASKFGFTQFLSQGPTVSSPKVW